MFDGVMLDVAIGLLLVFLVSSLIASAVVEAIGGFLHRRAKHLWDTLDLLLGNTSVDDGERSLVDELYRTPFITGLVRPTTRARFDPASGEQRNGKVPLRAAPPQALADAAVVDTRATEAQQQLRRYYGPIHIDPHEFTNGLLAVLRPEGKLDQSLAVLQALRAELDDQSGTDIAIGDIGELLDELRSAATSIRAGDVTDAIDALRAGGERVDIDNVRDVVADAEAALLGFFTGDPSREQLVAALDVVPRDLRVKLLAVLDEAGDEIVSIRAGIEKWYERTMDAASTWYRKQTRWFLFGVGLVMAMSMNVDAVGAARTLYRDETTREAVVALAYQVNDVTCVEDVGAGDGATAAPPDLDCVRDSVGGSLPLPVGWDEIDTSATGWVLRVFGWILVAGAVTVGAPFWFDLLGRALRHRSRDGSKG